MNIKPCMGNISGIWELLLYEYWRKSMIIGEKNTDLTEIGRFHCNQGEEVAHFAWFGEPWFYVLLWSSDMSLFSYLITLSMTVSLSHRLSNICTIMDCCRGLPVANVSSTLTLSCSTNGKAICNKNEWVIVA